MDSARYLARVGLTPGDATPPSVDALARLQRAHVTSVPFETLAITGDPFGDRDGRGVTLDPSALFEKLVDRNRGGFCYELNGLFGGLLAALGYDADRRAAMVVSDGDPGPPANHLTHVVSLDRDYLVDVGMGVPTLRTPLPMSGDAREDDAGVAWRVTDTSRPDCDYALEYREPGGDWGVRYVFRDVPRDRSYFQATCDYLSSAPESPFTGDPVVSRATTDGHVKLTPDSLTRYRGGSETERGVTPDEWYDLLDSEFGIDYPRPRADP